MKAMFSQSTASEGYAAPRILRRSTKKSPHKRQIFDQLNNSEEDSLLIGKKDHLTFLDAFSIALGGILIGFPVCGFLPSLFSSWYADPFSAVAAAGW